MPSIFDTVLCEFSIEDAEIVAAALSFLDRDLGGTDFLPSIRDHIREKTEATKALAESRATT